VSEYPQSLKLFSLCLENSFRNVTLVPEESEDMWHAYNLIAKGDSVRSTTIRKVQNETATGSSTSSRVRTTLTIACSVTTNEGSQLKSQITSIQQEIERLLV